MNNFVSNMANHSIMDKKGSKFEMRFSQRY